MVVVVVVVVVDECVAIDDVLLVGGGARGDTTIGYDPPCGTGTRGPTGGRWGAPPIWGRRDGPRGPRVLAVCDAAQWHAFPYVQTPLVVQCLQDILLSGRWGGAERVVRSSTSPCGTESCADVAAREGGENAVRAGEEWSHLFVFGILFMGTEWGCVSVKCC